MGDAFQQFAKELNKHINDNFFEEETLFTLNAEREMLWLCYLESFAPEHNEIFQERREHDCNTCRMFIMRFGHVAKITDELKVVSIWDDFVPSSDIYKPSVDALREYCRELKIGGIFVAKRESQYGAEQTKDANRKDSKLRPLVWRHMWVNPPKKFYQYDANVQGDFQDSQTVFRKGLTFREQDIVDVLALMDADEIHRSDQYREGLRRFLELYRKYHDLEDPTQKENFIFRSVMKKRHDCLIPANVTGTLLEDLRDGLSVDDAVKKFESKVSGGNYMRKKPVVSQAQIDRAQKFLEEHGFMQSLERRFAQMEDVHVRNVIYADRRRAKRMTGVESIFQSARESAPRKSVKVDSRKIKTVPIDEALEMIKELGMDQSVQALVETPHMSNFVSLTVPVNPNSPPIFKWGQEGWVYRGNVTMADMKSRVQAFGGSVVGLWRNTIQWNDEVGHDQNDLDLHCLEPDRNHIYYNNKGIVHRSGGKLDVDIVHPGPKPAVENIIYPRPPQKGEHRVYVNNYTYRGGDTGFRAEIEIDGVIYRFDYRERLRNKEDVLIARVHHDGVGNFKIAEALPHEEDRQTIWGLQMGQFHPVTFICTSPNYWGGKEIGTKHYFFMLDGCVNPDSPIALFNEFLIPELREHSRMMEYLGKKITAPETPDQLSGLGFNVADKHQNIVLKIGDTVVKTTF